MFNASTAFLPSTFAMYTSMLGLSVFLKSALQKRTIEIIFWFFLGGIVGWPFSLILTIPIIFYEFLMSIYNIPLKQVFLKYLKAIFVCFIILAFVCLVDSLAYRKFQIVPLNIIKYNVFNAKGKGPEIFGVEPWWFYFLNLLLNFNGVFILCFLSLPIMFFYFSRFSLNIVKKGFLLSIISPFYLWFFIFTIQPHKEERFFFPIYPFICLNASVAISRLLSLIKSYNNSRYISCILRYIHIFISASVLVISFLRILLIIDVYSAHMSVYMKIPSVSDNFGSILCIGKEWHRFPSSFFVPDNISVKFIKSRFTGLLPGEFISNKDGWRSGMWLIPSNMNDLNIEEWGKYTDISQCDYLVDTDFFARYSFQNSTEDIIEPRYLKNEEKWKKIFCMNFLDASSTKIYSRILWIPSKFSRRIYGNYCLLKSRNKVR
ncbi:hypothetical protein T552_02902 [Pneumocystis carinii B80]|uniref:Mannosyltransferase n=1 Tax=Pneumocystis carinii (strain B80) TaxID=1408658 RepID=A0A0W4ZDL3_PNEC8|nr:hypothetical protein T552_02902 [Pneumocystis carinii B80]KTW26421.1 hypothetical protein T552_02902 [Pneumocystis carinii B80]